MSGNGKSAASTLDLVAQGRQFCHDLITVVALDFDVAIFDCTAGAAQFLELLCKCSNRRIVSLYTANHRDDLATTLLAIAHDTHNSVTFLDWCVRLVTMAMFIWLS